MDQILSESETIASLHAHVLQLMAMISIGTANHACHLRPAHTGTVTSLPSGAICDAPQAFWLFWAILLMRIHNACGTVTPLSQLHLFDMTFWGL
jgi:hypothetical protein